MQEPGIREAVIRMLWEKQFEGSPWQSKFHLIRPDSLNADYGALADKIIKTIRADIEECFELKDRRSPGSEIIATPDPSAPTCEHCGAVVHNPCPTTKMQETCELPDFCFPNGRR